MVACRVKSLRGVRPRPRGRPPPSVICTLTRRFIARAQLRALAADLHEIIYSGGIAECDYGSQLFDARRYDIRSLPPALLDAKEERPPLDTIPTRKDELRPFLEKLMVCNGRENHLDLLVIGWGKADARGRPFHRHIENLWPLRGENQPLYEALVAGRFAPVIRHLRAIGDAPKNGVTLRRVLIQQAPIWCCHDVQMVVARLGKTIEFGMLGTNSKKQQSPEGELNNLRHRYAALEETLTLFFGTDDWRTHDIESIAAAVVFDMANPGNQRIRRIERSLRKRLGKQMFSIARPEEVTVLMRAVAAELREPDEMLAKMATAKTANAEPKTFDAMWFQLKSPTTAIAAAIRRLIQAEQEIPAIVAGLITNQNRSGPTALRGALSGYGVFDLTRGSDSRLDELMFFTVRLCIATADRNVKARGPIGSRRARLANFC